MSHDQENSKRQRARWPLGVWASLVAAFTIFTLTTFVIYYRYVTTPETNCMVVVAGNSTLEGFNVVVERLTQDQGRKGSFRDTLNQGNQYHARFFLTSGTYRVEVWDTRPERIMVESDFIPPGTRLTLDLNRKYPATRPGPTPEAPSPR